MKTFTIASVIALATVATAQLNVPDCSLSCLITPLSTDGCSSLTDFACHCSKGASLISSVSSCIAGSCSAADQATTLNVIQAACQAAGVPLSVSPSGVASSARASASGAVSSAASLASSARSAASSAAASAASSARSAASSAAGSAASAASSAAGSAASAASSAASRASSALASITAAASSARASATAATGAAPQVTQAAGLLGAAAIALLAL